MDDSQFWKPARKAGQGFFSRFPPLIKCLRSSKDRNRGVTIPLFSGFESGSGIVPKRAGIGITWIRIHAGIGSMIGIGSILDIYISNIDSGGPFSLISLKVT